MSAILTTLLSLIEQFLPAIAGGNASAIQSVIKVLVQLIPVLTQEYEDLRPIIQNIIDALRDDPATTGKQLETLDELDAKVDAAFEEAATAAEAED